jgi:hypothetical protein
LARALKPSKPKLVILLEVGPKMGVAGNTFKPTKLPLTFEATRSKTMKNAKSIIYSTMLVLAISAPTFAKGGTISTTKTGTISTTRTGTISTTASGTNRTGTISTTRAGIISTTRHESGVGLDGFSVLELLLAMFVAR